MNVFVFSRCVLSEGRSQRPLAAFPGAPSPSSGRSGQEASRQVPGPPGSPQERRGGAPQISSSAHCSAPLLFSEGCGSETSGGDSKWKSLRKAHRFSTVLKGDTTDPKGPRTTCAADAFCGGLRAPSGSPEEGRSSGHAKLRPARPDGEASPYIQVGSKWQSHRPFSEKKRLSPDLGRTPCRKRGSASAALTGAGERTADKRLGLPQAPASVTVRFPD